MLGATLFPLRFSCRQIVKSTIKQVDKSRYFATTFAMTSVVCWVCCEEEGDGETEGAHYVNDKGARYTGTLNAGKPWQLLATLWRPPSLLSSAGHINQRNRER